MKTMQKFFMMLTVVLMAGFMTSCGSDDDNNSGSLGSYTIGFTVSDKGVLSDTEVSMMIFLKIWSKPLIMFLNQRQKLFLRNHSGELTLHNWILARTILSSII